MNKKQTILLVEDESSTRKALIDKFTREGFKMIKAINGQEGLKKAKKYHPDLILLDIIMPKMDGMTMLKKLRQDKWGRKAEVILLTNLSDNEKIAEAMDRGVYNFLIKTDWKIDEVVKRVRQRLQ